MTLSSRSWLPALPMQRIEKYLPPVADRFDWLFKIADSRDELREAFHLLYQEYLQAGYVKPREDRLLRTAHHLQPETIVLTAKSGRSVLSTATIVFDSTTAGLPMDALYGSEINTLRRQDRKVVEVCSLASNRHAFTLGGIHNFTRLLFLSCFFLKVDDVCVMVNPKHVPLYKRLCDLELFGEERHYDKVDAPAVALRTDIRKARQQVARSCSMREFGARLEAHFLSERIGLCDGILDILRGGHGPASGQPSPHADLPGRIIPGLHPPILGTAVQANGLFSSD